MSTWLRPLNRSLYIIRSHSKLTNQTVRLSTCIPNELFNRVRDIVGEGNLSVSEAARLQHGRDESYHSPLAPDLLTFPTSTQQVSIIIVS